MADIAYTLREWTGNDDIRTIQPAGEAMSKAFRAIGLATDPDSSAETVAVRINTEGGPARWDQYTVDIPSTDRDRLRAELAKDPRVTTIDGEPAANFKAEPVDQGEHRTGFRVNDRVRYTGNDPATRQRSRIGWEGAVTEIDSPTSVWVQWDGEDIHSHLPVNLEKIEPEAKPDTEKTAEELAAELAALKAEHEKFKRTVARKAKALGRANNWCTVVDDGLRDLGLLELAQPEKFIFTVELKTGDMNNGFNPRISAQDPEIISAFWSAVEDSTYYTRRDVTVSVTKVGDN